MLRNYQLTPDPLLWRHNLAELPDGLDVLVHRASSAPPAPHTVFGIGRAGLFRSAEQGNHWQYITLGPLNDKGQTYCRTICETPGDPKTVWVAGGSAFRSNDGVLFRSRDSGLNWERADQGLDCHSTVFGIAFDRRQPKQMYCGTATGEVFGSQDGGETWDATPLPEGATQLYSLACG